MNNKNTKAFLPATFEQLTIKAEMPSVAETHATSLSTWVGLSAMCVLCPEYIAMRHAPP